MRLLNKSLLLIFCILLFSCKKEDPQPGLAKITLTGILLEKPISNGRLNTNQEWNHSLSPSQSVTFTSQESGDSYTIQLPSNPEGFTFELPFGSYIYESPISSNLISSTLPVDLSGTLSVSSPEVSTQLNGVSRYQLLSIQKSNLQSAPQIITPQTGRMGSQGDFYYIYTLETVKTAITLTNGQRFRLGLDPSPLSHQSFFYFNSSNSIGQIGISDPIFDLNQRTISLAEDTYPQVFPPFNRRELGFPLGETSGLEGIDSRLFTINDGGNLPELFEISPESGAFQRIIRVANASNVDWEDLASSNTHVFIGDFGNNLGNRKDLRILKIPILELLNSTTVTAEILEFSYPDQNTFDDPNHRFDCEAMVFWDGKLHLFTKPVSVNETTHYTLDPDLSSQVAAKRGTFQTAGKITAADVTSNGKNLLLLGYELTGISSRAFVEVFTGLAPGQIQPESNRYTLYLGNVSSTSQTEGIAVLPEGSIKISGEQIAVGGITIPPRLFEIDLTGLLED